MPEEFEFREMKDASFWGVDLEGATFRDVDLTGVTISHARVVDVSIDAFVERLTVNGVDVTDFVNQHDVWSPLRVMLLPPDPAAMRATWDALDAAWAPAIVRGAALPPEQQHRIARLRLARRRSRPRSAPRRRPRGARRTRRSLP